jgi:hypothetical protein
MSNTVNLRASIAGCLALVASACAANPPPCPAAALPPPPPLPPAQPHCGPPPQWARDRGGPEIGWTHEYPPESGPVARSAGQSRGPFWEAIEACNGKKSGDECIAKKGEWELRGACRSGPGDNSDGHLACAPTEAHGPLPGGQVVPNIGPGQKPKK